MNLLKIYDDFMKFSRNSLNQGAQQFNPQFFNRGNTFTNWATDKLPQDIQRRGWIEGIHDLSNPILTHPRIEPTAERYISDARKYMSSYPAMNWWTQPTRRFLGIQPRPVTPNSNPYAPYPFSEADKNEIYPQMMGRFNMPYAQPTNRQLKSYLPNNIQTPRMR